MTIRVSLGKQKKVVRELVRSGRYPSMDEVLKDAVQLREAEFELRSAELRYEAALREASNSARCAPGTTSEA